jgi:DNA polymerase III gamma/tau subunit
VPRPSPIDDMTADQRQAFEAELIRRNFKDYDGLVEWLKGNGLEISRSAAYRHGSKLQRRLQAVRNSTEAAKLIAEAAPDDADLRSAAVISMVQSELFDVMVTLQDLDEAEPGERVMLLKEAARSVLDMTKASVLQKKWQQEMQARVQAAAEKVTETVRAAGVSQETIEIIRRDVLGLAS